MPATDGIDAQELSEPLLARLIYFILTSLIGCFKPSDGHRTDETRFARARVQRRRNRCIGPSLSRRGVPQHDLADAPRQHDQLGRCRLGHCRLGSVLQSPSLAVAAVARRRPHHRVSGLRGAALPLLQCLARTGAMDRDVLLRSHAARRRREFWRRLASDPGQRLLRAAPPHKPCCAPSGVGCVAITSGF